MVSTWLYFRVICSPFTKYWCLGPILKLYGSVGLRWQPGISPFLEVPRWFWCAAGAKLTGLERHGLWNLKGGSPAWQLPTVPPEQARRRYSPLQIEKLRFKVILHALKGIKWYHNARSRGQANHHQLRKSLKEKLLKLSSVNLAVNHGFSPWSNHHL